MVDSSKVGRRDTLKLGLAAAATGAGAGMVRAEEVPQSGLLFPDTYRQGIVRNPSPPSTPFVAPLNVIPRARPVPESALRPGPDPRSHQRYNEFRPQKFYIQNLSEFKWQYHPEGVYRDGSWSWGFNGMTPGETIVGRYGEPLLVRRQNNLPPVGTGNIGWALPSSSIHHHNGHTASESDGIPQDFTYPGEFWDHHYAMFPAGFDKRETMGTLWYHDHRLDFTATNVYAGLSGFFLLFDDLDSDNERDRNPKAFRLPSGKYDIPLILHDVRFDQNGQPAFDFTDPHTVPVPFNKHPRSVPNPLGQAYEPGPTYTNHGMLGDKFTVNRIIQPFHKVERRKYRFRILNGGPSRLYKLFLTTDTSDAEKFYLISNDGNLLPEAIETTSIDCWVANRLDIIVDFSKYPPGTKIYLTNRLEMREDGAGPQGRLLDEGDRIMRFDVVGGRVEDPSRIPDFMRELPPINLSEVRKRRTFKFDYDNGLWTVNGRLMDPDRVDAKIEQGSAEIWTFQNNGQQWAHPVHTHFEEFQIISINGKALPPNSPLRARKDVVELEPMTEVTFYGRWRDFLGKHVMHCHNVVHEDHAMMIRWDIVPKGQGD